MRYLSFLICFLFFAQAARAQEEIDTHSSVCSPFELFMELQGRGSSQGGACYGKYLFVGIAGNRTIDVYDLEKKNTLESITIPGAHPSCHANTLNFGSLFYSTDDEFPLLYVSSGNNIDSESNISNVYVYRIKKVVTSQGSDHFTASLVQTISLVGFGGWKECIFDRVENVIWIFNQHDNQLHYLQFPVPDVHQKEVTFTPSEACDSISVDDIGAIGNCQGFFCHDGYIYYPAGKSGQVPFLVAVSLSKHDYEYIINLNEVEDIRRTRFGEPEYIIFYEGAYHIGFRKNIYRIDLEQVKQANYFLNRYRLTH